MNKAKLKGYRTKSKFINDFYSNAIVDSVEKTSRFADQKDLFGLFDIIALNQFEAHFIQITTNTPHTHKKYSDFSSKFPYLNIYQYVWYDRKGWKIFQYVKGEKIVTDLRKK